MSPDQDPLPARTYAEDKLKRKEQITAGLIESLYARMPVTIAVNILVGILTAAILSGPIPVPALATWLGLVVAVAAARGVLWFRYRKIRPAAADAPKWGWWGAAGALAAGLLWAGAAVAFFIPQDFVEHVFLTFVLGGMATGAVATSTSFLPAFYFFVGPAVGSATLMFLSQPDHTHFVMAIMLVIYGAALAVIAKEVNASQVQSLSLRADNEGLIRTLLKTSEDAQSANRAKSAFLASMSHELRTPLNAIIGFSEIMRDEMFGALAPSPYRDYAVLIHESAEHLLDVINDILDASRAEAGTLTIEEGIVDLVAVARNCIGVMAGNISAHNLFLATEFESGVPQLRADYRRTRQIIFNLLLNAVKFTPEGGAITIRIRRDPEGRVVLSVSDTGIGMSEPEIATALEPFAQVDASISRRFPGTGLGLPLARTLMQLHGGDLLLDSRPGHGTTVTVRFPRERVLGNGQNSNGGRNGGHNGGSKGGRAKGGNGGVDGGGNGGGRPPGA